MPEVPPMMTIDLFLRVGCPGVVDMMGRILGGSGVGRQQSRRAGVLLRDVCRQRRYV